MARKLSGPDAARRRYLVAQTGLAVAFALVTVGASALIARAEGPQRWLLAAAPVAVLILWAWEFYRVVRDDDEMMQALYLRTAAISGMLVLFGATTWGLVERLLGAPPFPGFLLLPAFALLYGLVSALLSRRA